MPDSQHPDNSNRPELHLLFVNGSSDRFVVNELVQWVVKREAVVALMLTAALVSIVAPPLLRDTSPYLAFTAAMIARFALFPPVFLGLLLLYDSVQRLRNRTIVIEPLVTFAAAVLVTFTGRAVGVLTKGEVTLTRGDILFQIMLNYVFWQGLVLLFFQFILPAHRKWNAVRAEQEVAPRSKGPQFRVGRLVLDTDCIRHIEVDDHYLVITAGSEAIRVIGRLSEAAAQLDGRGMTVHRSHWLAFEEFGAISRHGRAFRMTTKSGGQVPISRERWRDVKRIAEEGAGTA